VITPRDADPTPEALAEVLGPYILIRRIGHGGMGEVWLARHGVSGTLGAVKRLGADRAQRARFAAYMAREGRAVLRLEHPHIVPVVEVGGDYLVMAYVAGGDLARRLNTPLAPADAIRLARQLAGALAHAHARGVVHCDVKPSNVLIDERGNAYLTDFGLAFFLDDPAMTLRPAGTPQFMAPEQRRGDAVGPATDQYALGRTLLEMLAGGRVPIEREAALAELPRDLPAALYDAIARATAAAPADRFPDMDAFDEALAAVELGAHAAPRRYAAIVRDPAPFAWAAGAHAIARDAGLVTRADYRLRDLARAGHLPADEADAILDRAALADVGFAMWGQTGRLGPLTAPEALARASDVVILLHGLGHTREAWPAIARAICRDNARAIVLTPDVHGMGETRFARRPTLEQAGPEALARAVDDWRRLLGLATIPTALFGHSIGGLAVLALDDDRAGLGVTRVALNPWLARKDAPMRRRAFWHARMADALGWISPLWRSVGRATIMRAPEVQCLSRASIEHFADELVRVQPRALAQILRAVAGAHPRIGRQKRAAIIACNDDPFVDPGVLDEVVAEMGLEPANVHRMPTGGHAPHAEMADHPEWSARNHVDLVRIIDQMLIGAHEIGSTSSDDVGLESTKPASASTA
jgi:hypothetical protein